MFYVTWRRFAAFEGMILTGEAKFPPTDHFHAENTGPKYFPGMSETISEATGSIKKYIAMM